MGKKYQVHLSRSADQTAEVEVTAECEEDAKSEAIGMVDDLNWNTDVLSTQVDDVECMEDDEE